MQHSSRFALLAILLLAFGLRVAGLESAPPGPRFDEVLVFMEADRIHAGSRPLYSADIYEEPLFHYLLTGAIELLGKRLIVGRWLAGAFGMLALATSYPLARRIAGRRAALWAVALMAVGFWPVLYSRFALRMTSMLPFVNAAVYLFWRGVSRPDRQTRRIMADFALAGLSLGVAVYTYAFGRYTPALFVAFALYLLIADRRLFQKRAACIGLALLIALALDAPLLLYLRAHPGIEQRFSQVSGPLDALAAGNALPVIEYAWTALSMAMWRGDPEWLYNLALRPVFDPLTGALFYIGLVVCLVRWRKLWNGATLAWWGVGIAPAILTWPPASFSHSVAAQPIFYLWAAMGLEQALNVQRLTLNVKRLIFCLLLALNVGLMIRDYFFVWANQPQVRAEYQASLTDLARYLESHDDLPVVAGGARVDVWNPSNGYGFGLVYRRPDRPVAWYNPAGALAWPPDSAEMLAALPRIEGDTLTFAPELVERFWEQAQLIHVEPSFALYRLRGRPALDARLMSQSVFMPGQMQPISLPANLDNRFRLLGYEAQPDLLQAGQTLAVITYWEAQESFWDSLIAFTHLIGPDGAVHAQSDRLDVFTDSLYPGVAFAQVHYLHLPVDLPVGRYHLQIGMYRSGDLTRLPFLIDSRPVADAVWLSDITVSKP